MTDPDFVLGSLNCKDLSAAPATTGDHLLRAVLCQPEEDTPRLVYADWLEENGDPDRAEFIRTEIQVARFGSKPHRTIGHEGGPVRPIEWIGQGLAITYALPDLNQQYAKGDRVDIWSVSSRGKVKWLRGLRVVSAEKEAREYDGVRLVLREDEHSGPWAGQPLLDRCKEIWNQMGCRWPFRTLPISCSVETVRGFIEKVEISVKELLKPDVMTTIFSREPVQEVVVRGVMIGESADGLGCGVVDDEGLTRVIPVHPDWDKGILTSGVGVVNLLSDSVVAEGRRLCGLPKIPRKFA